MKVKERKTIVKIIDLADKLSSLKIPDELELSKKYDAISNELLNLIWSEETRFLEFSFCEFCNKTDFKENLQDFNGWGNFYCRECEIKKGFNHSCGIKNEYHEEFRCFYDGNSLVLSSPDSPDVNVKFCPFCGFSIGSKNEMD